jgi:tRNA(Arg) A34 adenosine deaminase TadA
MQRLLEGLIKEFATVEEHAKNNQKCLRKAVGCSTVMVNFRGSVLPVHRAHNGPSLPDAVCSNIVGNCGCSHAEPRALMESIHHYDDTEFMMICTYSPCRTCANMIIDSGVIGFMMYDILTVYADGRENGGREGIDMIAQVMPVLTLTDLRSMLAGLSTDTMKVLKDYVEKE